MKRPSLCLGFLLAVLFAPGSLSAQGAPPADHRFTLRDIFELEWAADPQIAPNGRRIAFERGSFDVMTDRERAALWIVNADGSELRPLLEPGRNAGSPRWSPDGTRLLYISSAEGRSEIFVRWMDTGQETNLTHVAESPGGMAWSPDGGWIAFTMFVPETPKPFVDLPSPPKGADWGPPIKFIDQLDYRGNGVGYLRSGHRHIFVLPAEGGTPRQLTDGPFNDGAPRWTPDGTALIFSANRHDGGEYEPRNTEIYEVSIATGAVNALTTRKGPDGDPTVSPDGRLIAYTGFDDRYQGYQVTHLYVMNRDGSGSRLVTGAFDRDIDNPVWSRDGKGLFFQYDDEGDTRIGYVTLAGNVTTITSRVGGLSLGRPYAGGSFSVSDDGRVAFTQTAPDHPADVAVGRAGEPARRLTRLNADLFDHKSLGTVEEIWYHSAYDQRRIQGWIVKPPDFDPQRKYPLILEIHGGPFADYGNRFAAELQLYAAAGYVVLYANPRGSTSYGEEFGNLIHHAYPGHDYDDLMTGVDSVVARGYVDADNLFVTGGSGGGVLSAWIVGHTDRFRAAVVAKPVINWYSFVLTADGPGFFAKYWFQGLPWDNLDQYMQRSPISYVGHVTTPTMLMTGEVDYRTPSEEAEQFYEALKLRKVPAAMVRIPDASHEIASKPSNMMAKVGYILAWFEKYRTGSMSTRATR
jgi:dipeptidyl aminopeptidase/acylaminoacyl peptidase